MINIVSSVEELNFINEREQQSNKKQQNSKNNEFKQILDEEIEKILDKNIKTKNLDEIIDAYKITNSKNLKIKDDLIR